VLSEAFTVRISPILLSSLDRPKGDSPLSIVQYTCGKCGKPTERSSSRCPHCGVAFSGVNCKGCGYTGSSSDFAGDVCPKCGKNPHTGAKPPGKQEPLTPKDKAGAAGCVAVLSLVIIALAVLSGMPGKCGTVTLVIGVILLLLTIPMTLDIFKREEEKDGQPPAEKPPVITPVQEKHASATLSPLPTIPSYPGVCPFPRYPRSGWKDPQSGGFFEPHIMSWNAGVKNANAGETQFIMSGEIKGKFLYAHFSKTNGSWNAVIDDYLP
jgi:hypothetical protein